jgi:uncharacterized protein YrrD
MSNITGEPGVSPHPPLPSEAPRPPGVHAKIRIGSQVLAPESEEQVGTVEKVVISPKTRQVTHLLIHRGPLPLLHHDMVVPVGAVSGVSETVMRLNVPLDVLNRMAASHNAGDYTIPGVEWQPPDEYRLNQVLFAFPGARERLNQLLPRNEGHTENTQTEPEGVLIGTDTKVEANGGSIGSVDRVLLDPDSGRVTHFVVRKGQLLPKHTIIPVEWAAEITPETIRLAVDREQLDALPEYRPDDEIAKDVLEALKSYPPIRRILHGIARYESVPSPYEEDTVRVTVLDGVVTLEGNVQTSGHASMAAWLAQQVPGVRQVRNLLVGDDDLEIAVAGALGSDERTHGLRAQVESFLGVVTLTGQAPNDAARAAAEKVASEMRGVRRVVNKLQVKAC